MQNRSPTDFQPLDVNALSRAVRIACLTLVALAGSAGGSTASAQEQFKFMSSPYAGMPIAFGTYIGRYTATAQSRPGAPTIDIYCIDYVNAAHFGATWNAYITNLGSDVALANVRHNQDGNTDGIADKLDTYRKAAWLTDHYASQPMTSAGWGGLQAAIWELFNPGNPDGGSNPSTVGSESWWLAQVNAFHANTVAWNSHEWGKYSVITDIIATGRPNGGFQEFIAVSPSLAPEPATFGLLAGGMLIVGFAARRRLRGVSKLS